MSNNLQAELAWPQLQKGVRAKCSMAAFPTMFAFREYRYQVSPVIMSHTLPQNYCSTSLLASVYKRLVEGRWGGHGCCCVSASLRTETLEVTLEIRGNTKQWKSEDRDIKRY
jgi:hypothetical protein